MKKKYILIIPGLAVIACLAIFSLIMISDRPNEKTNGFERQFISDALVKLHTRSDNLNYFDIVGATEHSFFLRDQKGNIFAITRNLTTLKTIVPDTITMSGAVSMSVDSPDVYIADHRKKLIIHLSLDSKARTTYQIHTPFTRVTTLSKGLFGLKGFDTTFNAQFYKTIRLNGSGRPEKKREITNVKKDGGFSSDGLLLYDQTLKSLVSLFFYSNRFTCLNTNLNFLYEGRTIDTITVPQIEVASLSSFPGRTSYTLSAPPVFVNKGGVVSAGKLYVKSALKADNESGRTFRNNTVIDVYDLKNGEYCGSFYVPQYKGIQSKIFKVFDDLLIALYDNHIVTYSLRLQ